MRLNSFRGSLQDKFTDIDQNCFGVWSLQPAAFTDGIGSPSVMRASLTEVLGTSMARPCSIRGMPAMPPPLGMTTPWPAFCVHWMSATDGSSSFGCVWASVRMSDLTVSWLCSVDEIVSSRLSTLKIPTSSSSVSLTPSASWSSQTRTPGNQSVHASASMSLVMSCNSSLLGSAPETISLTQLLRDRNTFNEIGAPSWAELAFPISLLLTSRFQGNCQVARLRLAPSIKLFANSVSLQPFDFRSVKNCMSLLASSNLCARDPVLVPSGPNPSGCHPLLAGSPWWSSITVFSGSIAVVTISAL